MAQDDTQDDTLIYEIRKVGEGDDVHTQATLVEIGSWGWDADTAIAGLVLPLITHMREHHISNPVDIRRRLDRMNLHYMEFRREGDQALWEDILAFIEWTMGLLQPSSDADILFFVNLTRWNREADDALQNLIGDGTRVFGEFFRDLWI